MNDPRDMRYYALQKKAKSSLSNLSRDELVEYRRYAEKMVNFAEKKGRRGWVELKAEIDEELG